MMNRSANLYEMNIAIVGQHHNPSILNQDFLWRKGIVPEDVGLDGEVPTFNTQMVSQCMFKNGLHIISEPHKIVFSETKIENEKPGCYDAAKKYLQVVPHVHYTAVGVNFAKYFSKADDKFGPHNMISDQSRNQYEGVYPSAEIMLTYPLADTTVNLTIKNENIPGLEDRQKLIMRGNFHRDIKSNSDESYQVAIAIADKWKSDLDRFDTLIKNIVTNMEGKRR